LKIQDGGGRRLEKTKNRHIPVLSIVVKFGVVTHLTLLTLKNSEF